MKRVILPLIMLISGFLLGYALLPAPTSDNTMQDHQNEEKEILYWVAPMDSSFRRDKPGKSPMGMDLVPVYADQESAEPGTVTITPQIEQSLGVTTATATFRDLSEPVNATGIVEVAEENILHVHPRVSGWIETLAVTADGQPVAKDSTLYTLYSPELVNAQEEYLLARSRNNQSLLKAARDRLKALELPDAVISKLDKTGKVQQQIAFPVPQNGYVTNLNVRPGFYVTPGTTLLAIASQQNVWVTADVPQRYAGTIMTKQPVTVTLPAYQEQVIESQVDFVYPQLDAQTRALKVRVKLDNPAGTLKPNMYANLAFYTPDEHRLSIPRSALIRTANNNRVVLALGEGKFRSASVSVGRITADYAEITAGLDEGDEVVMNGLFLIDSESAVDADLSRISAPHSSQHVMQSSSSQSATVDGVINSIDDAMGIINISRGPIEKWGRGPATMDFTVADDVALSSWHSEQAIRFTFEIRGEDFVITHIEPAMVMSDDMDHAGH